MNKLDIVKLLSGEILPGDYVVNNPVLTPDKILVASHFELKTKFYIKKIDLRSNLNSISIPTYDNPYGNFTAAYSLDLIIHTTSTGVVLDSTFNNLKNLRELYL